MIVGAILAIAQNRANLPVSPWLRAMKTIGFARTFLKGYFMFRVKICGVTRSKDVRAIAQAGADAIGFQMSMGPRKLSAQQAKRLVRLVPPLVTPVGVFVNEPLSRVKRLIKLCGFQAVQLHGEEGKTYCEKLDVPVIKVIRMKNPLSYKAFRGFRVAAFYWTPIIKTFPAEPVKVSNRFGPGRLLKNFRRRFYWRAG